MNIKLQSSFIKYFFGRTFPVFACIALLYFQSGCTGRETFSNTARGGDTVAVAFGQAPNTTRANTVITIIDSEGTKTVYQPGDPRVRAIINMYPDPVSYLVVGNETNQNFRSFENSFGSSISVANNLSKEWKLSVAYIDLPDQMALGIATVSIEGAYDYVESNVNIIGNGGTPHPFEIHQSGFSGIEHAETLERMPHYAIKVKGGSPYAIEMQFSHNPDMDNNGQGRAFVVNPRGDLTSLSWSDDGSNLHVMLTPTKDVAIPNPQENFKFYVAGGISGLVVQSVAGYDENGNVIDGIEASIQPVITSSSPGGAVSAGQTVTIQGEYLCLDCSTPDSDVWIENNDSWTQLAATSVTANSIVFDMPANIVAGGAMFWVGTNGGEYHHWFDTQ